MISDKLLTVAVLLVVNTPWHCAFAEEDENVAKIIRENSTSIREIELAKPLLDGARPSIPEIVETRDTHEILPTAAETVFQWTRTGVTHHPAYFDQPGVEIGGFSRGPVRQPLASGVCFFVTATTLPIEMIVEHPCSDVAYRPATPPPGSPSCPYRKQSALELIYDNLRTNRMFR